jgi:hypothetical protein
MNVNEWEYVSRNDDGCTTIVQTTMTTTPLLFTSAVMSETKRRRRCIKSSQSFVPFYKQSTSSLHVMALEVLILIALIACTIPNNIAYAQVTPVQAPNFGFLPCGLCERGQLPLLSDAIVPAGTVSFITEDVNCKTLEQRAQNAEFSPSQCIQMRRTTAPTICGCEIPETRPPATRRPIRPPTAPQPIAVVTTSSPSRTIVTTTAPILLPTIANVTTAPVPTIINGTTAPVPSVLEPTAPSPTGPKYSIGSGSVSIEMRVVGSIMSEQVQQYYNQQFQTFLTQVWQNNIFDVQSSVMKQVLMQPLPSNDTSSSSPVNASTPSSTGNNSINNATRRFLMQNNDRSMKYQQQNRETFNRLLQSATITLVPIQFECNVTAFVRIQEPPLPTDLGQPLVDAITLYSSLFIDLLQGDVIANITNSTTNSTITDADNTTGIIDTDNTTGINLSRVLARQGVFYSGNHFQRSLQTDPIELEIVEEGQLYFANLTDIKASLVQVPPPPPTSAPPLVTTRSTGIGLGGYIGIGVGAVAALLLILGLVALNKQKHKRQVEERRRINESSSDSNDGITGPKNSGSGSGNNNTVRVQAATTNANNTASQLEQVPVRVPLASSTNTGSTGAKPPQSTSSIKPPPPSSYNPFAGGAADTAAGLGSSTTTGRNNTSTALGVSAAAATTTAANGTGRNSNYNSTNATTGSSARPQSSTLAQKQSLTSSTPSPPEPTPPSTSMFAKKNPASTSSANMAASTTTPIVSAPQPTSIFQKKQAASEPSVPVTSSYRPTASAALNSTPNTTSATGAGPASGGGGGFAMAAALASTITGRKQQSDEPKPTPVIPSTQKQQQPPPPPVQQNVPPQDESTIGSTSANSYNRSKYGSAADTIGDDNSLEQQTLGGAVSEYGGNDAMSYAYSLDAGNMNDGGTLGGTIGGSSYQPSQGVGTVGGGGYGSSTGGGGGGGGSSRYSDTGGNTSLTGTQSGDDVSSHAMSSLRQNMVSRTVIAPPGKLGIVIDTTLEGPVVHKVNPQSPLEGSLFPGDIIVAIDDVDTRAMSASAITALMVRTANLRRKLTVLSEDITN